MYNYKNDKNLLAEEQNGFRQGRSCQDRVFTLSMALRSRL